jgi:hypothetical protein
MDRFDFVSPVDQRDADALAPAPRLSGLAGARLGLLDNRKGNGDVLLERLAERLAGDGARVGVRVEKRIFSRPASAEDLDRLVAGADAVLTAIGD